MKKESTTLKKKSVVSNGELFDIGIGMLEHYKDDTKNSLALSFLKVAIWTTAAISSLTINSEYHIAVLFIVVATWAMFGVSIGGMVQDAIAIKNISGLIATTKALKKSSK